MVIMARKVGKVMMKKRKMLLLTCASALGLGKTGIHKSGELHVSCLQPGVHSSLINRTYHTE